MSNIADTSNLKTRHAGRHGGTARTALLCALLLALLAMLPGGLQAQAAQESEPEAPAATEAVEPPAEPPAPEAAELRRLVESRYEVLPVRGGLVLRPREDYRGVRTIEITGSDLAVNGRMVDRGELRSWMGERADSVLRLADLPVEERWRLFELEEPAAATVTGEAEDADEAAEAAEAEDPGEGAGATAVAVAPEIPEERAERRRTVRRGSQTVVGSTVRIASDETADDVVVLGGSAEIDGRVEGDVTVFGGRVDVEGEVTRDVTAVGGNVHLGEDSEVGGEVTAVGGRVRREPGARVRGGINEIQRGFGRGRYAPIWGGWDWWDWEGPGFSPWGWTMNLTWPIVELVFLALLVVFFLAVARPTVERLGIRAGNEPVKAGVVGVLTGILIFPAFLIVSLLLAVSIIGIPILIVLVLLFVFVGIPALVIAALVGYSGVAWRIGRWSERRFGWRLESAFMAAIVGLLFLHGLELVGKALDVGPLRVFAVMFLVAAAIVQCIAWCVGFGAVVLDLYERRQQRRAALVPPPAAPRPPAGAGGTAPDPPPPAAPQPEPPPG